CGGMARYAGRKKAPTKPKLNPSATRCQSWSWWVQPSSAMASTMRARPASDQKMSGRRGRRSAAMPPKSKKRRRALVVAARINPIAVPEWVSSNTCQASAGVYAPSPSAEIVCPPQSNANDRDRNARANRIRRAARTLMQILPPSAARVTTVTCNCRYIVLCTAGCCNAHDVGWGGTAHARCGDGAMGAMLYCSHSACYTARTRHAILLSAGCPSDSAEGKTRADSSYIASFNHGQSLAPDVRCTAQASSACVAPYPRGARREGGGKPWLHQHARAQRAPPLPSGRHPLA